MIKLLVVGDFKGHHRSQLFLKKLHDKDIGSDDNFILSFANPKAFSVDFTATNLAARAARKALNMLTKTLFLVEIFLKIPFTDKVYLLAMNHRLFIPLYLFNMIWRKPIIVDLYISCYDAAKDRGFTRAPLAKKLVAMNFHWYLKMLDRMIMERADLVIYVGETELKLVAKEVGADLLKANYQTIPPASLRKKIACPDKSDIFRICWWGTFTPFHGIDNILKAGSILKRNGVSFTLDLFGTPKHDGAAYERVIAEHGLGGAVTLHTDKTFGNGKLVGWLVDKCDLALGNFGATERARRAVPTKIIDAFSMRIPVVTMDTKVVREYASVDHDLFTCAADAQSLAKVIMSTINDRAELDRRAANGYAVYERKFAPEAVQKTFDAAIRGV